MDSPESHVSIVNRDTRAEELNNQSAEFMKHSLFENVEHCARECLGLFAENELSIHKAIAMSTLGIVHRNHGALEEALRYLQQAYDMLQSLGEIKRSTRVLLNMGNVYANMSQYPQALEKFFLALAQNESDNESIIKSTASANVAIVYSSLGDYSSALEYIQVALKVDEEQHDTVSLARHLGNTGMIYLDLRDHQRAHEYYMRALDLARQIDDQKLVGAYTGSIGSVLYYLGEYDEALTYVQTALSSMQAQGLKLHEAIETSNLGKLYKALNQYEMALECYLKTKSMYEDMQHPEGIATECRNIGSLYATKEFNGYDLNFAIEWLKKSVDLCDHVGNRRDLYEAHLMLATIYEEQRDWELFAHHFKSYHTLERDVMSADVQRNAENFEFRRKVEETERAHQIKLARFEEQERILYNILPSTIAQRIVDGEKTIADHFSNVSIFFSDIVGFTKLSQRVSPEQLVGTLNTIFSHFDVLARQHGLEKIKTIGDAYMVVSGAPNANARHAVDIALFAQDVLTYMQSVVSPIGEPIDVRIGLHCGTVVAGVIGESKFAYDMWGDAVNTASRMESHGKAQHIHVSDDFRTELLRVDVLDLPNLRFEDRGEIDIKGKGTMRTYFLHVDSI